MSLLICLRHLIQLLVFRFCCLFTW